MMKSLFTKILIVLFLVAGAQTAAAAKPDNPGNSGASTTEESETSENSGDDDALDIFKIQGSKKGLIKLNKENFCTGETFSVGVVFPKSLRAVWTGQADVHLVIWLPDGGPDNPLSAPLFLNGEFPDKPMNLFEIPLEPDTALPAGTYQFALVLTKPNEMQLSDNSEPAGEEGDSPSDTPPPYEHLSPLELGNWYQGFAGLVSAKAVKISDVCDELPAASAASENDSE